MNRKHIYERIHIDTPEHPVRRTSLCQNIRMAG